MTDKTQDKFFFSPDVGNLVHQGDSYYTQHGEVLPITTAIRMIAVHDGAHDNYANWTNAFRRKVRERCASQLEQQQQAAADDQARRNAFVEQACSKLTADEFDAIYNLGWDEGSR